ncbi:PAS domain-containing protein [Pararhizobium sp.]|uniref:PAS domain-containing protein n=1 Tax=Pararhizobium sp. TaxID=1977563 RepID=UPI00271DD7FF|nr:PAS domain-containing protein [Pararhizobium sp.]MDO9415339.1 PAS domain-containing protein [Pararhizobium sp.]
MRNKASIELYTYWDRLRGKRTAPRRQEIEPGDIRRILPDLFILEHLSTDGIRIRLAGTNICNLFGRELRGTRFDGIWMHESRQTLVAQSFRAMQMSTPVILSLTGHGAHGEDMALEIIMLPLSSGGTLPDRLIGAMTLIDRVPSPVPLSLTGLSLNGIRMIDTTKVNAFLENRPEIPVASTISAVRSGFGSTIRRVLHLRVFEGGRQD